jgi:hypothetical protein
MIWMTKDKKLTNAPGAHFGVKQIYQYRQRVTMQALRLTQPCPCVAHSAYPRR